MSARVAPRKRRNGLALPIDHLLRSNETLGKRMPSAPGDGNRPQAPASSENERCPRCDSLDTKFCYYNNYNLAQPRHFCKSCRRYWTLGGTLRNVPMGGATHKKSSSSSSSSRSKRRRPSSGSPPSSTSSSADPATISATRTPSAPPSLEPADDSATNDVAGSFGSLLTEPLPTGFLALGEPFFQGRGGFDLGLGLGLGSAGFEEMGFGLGRTVWPFLGDEEEEVNDDALGGEAGDGEADCFAWPELGISSTQGKGLQ